MRYKLFVMHIILVILILGLVGCDDTKKELQNQPSIVAEYDDLFQKQWYLQRKYNDSLVDDVDVASQEDDTENGFVPSRFEKEINSGIDLGILDFFRMKEAEMSNKQLTIALIDSCVDIEHDDLKKYIWKNTNEIPDNDIDDDKNGYVDDYTGWNFIENSNHVGKDTNSSIHGTHCAGIIAAEHNKIGTMGILGKTNTKIMTLPILEDDDTDSDNEKTVQRLIEAIQYAEKMGADICNLSCSFAKTNSKLKKVIENSKMYFVVAAGNFESGYIQGINLTKHQRYPACYNFSNVIAVGSITEKQSMSTFSNYSSEYIDIAAPGEYIYSTAPNNTYCFSSGTSMSTPIVTGIIGAYYFSNDISLQQAVQSLYSNALCETTIKDKVKEGRVACYRQK